jgi:two-component sensor histidine kinase
MNADELSNFFIDLLEGNLSITLDEIVSENDLERQKVLYGLHTLHEELNFEKDRRLKLNEDIKAAFLNISSVVLLNREWEIEEVNVNFLNFTQQSLDSIKNLPLAELLDNGDKTAENFNALKTSIENNSSWQGIIGFKKSKTKVGWMDLKAIILASGEHHQEQIWLIGKDITDEIELEQELKETNENLRNSLEQKEFLLRELHHRVKNNLQMIASVFVLQLQTEKDQKLADHLQKIQNKIFSLSKLHDILVEQASLNNVDLVGYLRAIAENLQISTGFEGEIFVEGDLFEISTQSAPHFGIILNELITNSIKHAWDSNSTENEIRVGIYTDSDNLVFHYADNGKGFNKNTVNRGLGTKLLDMLILNQFKATELQCGEIEHSNCQCFKIDIANLN